MKIILTHEQADLDALASLLGAHLLDPEAIALLPRNINRNALEFIQAHQEDLGYSQYHTLTKDQITHITLVDTQSLVTLKGMTKSTLVNVIDHHPRKEGVNEDWQIEISHTGACTTLLVEKLRSQDIAIKPIQATMLLLGIYEDTGSLSYSTTTARDLCAAAFLLDKGADLRIVGDHLNPPLTTIQQVLYDRVMKNLETHVIENQTIITARANAMDINDEISSIAHKLRDFLDPDALLLMVLTKQGIRLVARATTDAVDVSKIASAFGGGGHARAASALIRPEGKLDPAEYQALLDKTYQDMLNLLKDHVKPLLCVRHIMSKNPLILTPDTRVDEVARLMQRYGFEGYPVVVNGNIVGLLNRRTVDRALSHKLSVSASSLMDAGNISVRPDDSLDTLTKVMASSGWGQIPVVDSQSGEIVGIATRTDLIKSRSTQKLQPNQASITRKLRKAVPLAHYELLSSLAKEAEQMNLPIYIVGGFVRDLLLGRKSIDFDIVVEGDAIYFVKQLVKTIGGRFVSHNRFGTAKWYLADDKTNIIKKMGSEEKIDPDALPDHLDLITARTEFYDHPAALPTIESSSIKMDLHRRDFTINTLALRLDGVHFGKIFDFWGGLSDLNDRKIRVLHALSFVDDATRLLRAVRFEQRFEFEIEERTLALMTESLPLLNEMTGIRLLHEIESILMEDRVVWMFDRLDEVGILHAIHPDLQWNDRVKSRINHLNSLEDPNPWEIKNYIERLSLRQVLGLMLLLMDIPTEKLVAIAERLKLNARFVEEIDHLKLLINDLPGMPGQLPSQVNRRLTNVPRLVLFAAYNITQYDDQKTILLAFVTSWSKVKPFTNGNNLYQLGLDASPKYTEILATLKDAWLDGRITSKEEEKALLNTLIKDLPHP